MKRYVIEFQYTGYPAKHMTDHKQINAACKLLNETWNNRDHVWVGMWESSKDFDKESMVLIDAEFLNKWPKLRHEKQQRAIREQLSFLSLPTTRPVFTMITWNVNFLRKRFSLMQTVITEHMPDILFLQETKLADEAFDKLALPRQYYAYRTGQKQFNGVAAYTRQQPTHVLTALPNCCESNHRFLQLTYDKTVCINVYIHQGQLIGSTAYNDKLTYMKQLTQHVHQLIHDGYVVFLAGDFNIMPHDHDLYNPEHPEWTEWAMISPPERAAYNSLLEVGLDDVMTTLLTPHTYTRWEYYHTSHDRSQGFRLDHFLISNHLVPQVKQLQVLRQYRAAPTPSDHAPVLLSIDMY
jgi:exodeoxyribonuclease-3